MSTTATSSSTKVPSGSSAAAKADLTIPHLVHRHIRPHLFHRHLRPRHLYTLCTLRQVLPNLEQRSYAHD